MAEDYLETLVGNLKLDGVRFATGLTDKEIDDTEKKYGFRFPIDLKALLQYALPVSDKWVDWRNSPEKSLRARLDWPADGICFDVEHNNFWLADWGPRPSTLSDAFTLARQRVAEAPTLIPIYSHRYIPGEPQEAGNPIFSVYQTDIIYYGVDLASYFINEFGSFGDGTDSEAQQGLGDSVNEGQTSHSATRSPRPIRFWDGFVE